MIAPAPPPILPEAFMVTVGVPAVVLTIPVEVVVISPPFTVVSWLMVTVVPAPTTISSPTLKVAPVTIVAVPAAVRLPLIELIPAGKVLEPLPDKVRW